MRLSVGNHKPLKGMGDVVALVAKPIKKVLVQYGPAPIKRLMEHCNCDKRQEKLNSLIPFSTE